MRAVGEEGEIMTIGKLLPLKKKKDQSISGFVCKCV
jgi:hypothetical protein